VGNALLSSYAAFRRVTLCKATTSSRSRSHQQSTGSTDCVFGIEIEATIPFTAGDIAINEVLANNRKAITNAGRNPDYIELFNNTFSNVDIGGWGLTDNVLESHQIRLPGGTTVPAQGYLTVWCDNDVRRPGLHSGFALSANGQTVALIQGSTIQGLRRIRPAGAGRRHWPLPERHRRIHRRHPLARRHEHRLHPRHPTTT
jgi:hypothetical protein